MEPHRSHDARTRRPAPLAADPEEFDERVRRNPAAIRADDTEPYLALQYIARLFKIVAMVVIVAVVFAIAAGIALEGIGAALPLFEQLIRGMVLAAVLWAAGDVTVLLINVGHDVRAARVLLGRLSAREGVLDDDAQDEPGLPDDEFEDER